MINNIFDIFNIFDITDINFIIALIMIVVFSIIISAYMYYIYKKIQNNQNAILNRQHNNIDLNTNPKKEKSNTIECDLNKIMGYEFIKIKNYTRDDFKEKKPIIHKKTTFNNTTSLQSSTRKEEVKEKQEIQNSEIITSNISSNTNKPPIETIKEPISTIDIYDNFNDNSEFDNLSMSIPPNQYAGIPNELYNNNDNYIDLNILDFIDNDQNNDTNCEKESEINKKFEIDKKFEEYKANLPEFDSELIIDMVTDMDMEEQSNKSV